MWFCLAFHFHSRKDRELCSKAVPPMVASIKGAWQTYALCGWTRYSQRTSAFCTFLYVLPEYVCFVLTEKLLLLKDTALWGFWEHQLSLCWQVIIICLNWLDCIFWEWSHLLYRKWCDSTRNAWGEVVSASVIGVFLSPPLGLQQSLCVIISRKAYFYVTCPWLLPTHSHNLLHASLLQIVQLDFTT